MILFLGGRHRVHVWSVTKARAGKERQGIGSYYSIYFQVQHAVQFFQVTACCAGRPTRRSEE